MTMKRGLLLCLLTPIIIGVVGLQTPHMPRQNGIVVQLEKRAATGPIPIELLKDHLEDVKRKYARSFAAYKANTGHDHALSFAYSLSNEDIMRRKTSPVPLEDRQHKGLIWAGNITIGTPPQPFFLLFDTGSADLIVPSVQCKYSSCNGRDKYNPAKSSTSKNLKRRFTTKFADDTTSLGNQYADTVQVGNIKVTNQVLGAANVLGFDPQVFPPDGIFGLAFPSISMLDGRMTVMFQTMINQGQVDRPVFGYQIATEGTSELLLGGVNSALYTGEFTYSSVVHEGHWQIAMDSVTVNGTKVVDSIPSIVDTGTALIMADPESVANLYKRIPKARRLSEDPIDRSGLWVLPCDTVVDVALTFAGKSWSIPRSAFILPTYIAGELGETLPRGMCVGGVAQDNDRAEKPSWTIGDVFLRGVYTVFDMGEKRVGFAQLS